jgi:Bacteriophage baseplate protein W
MSARSPLGKGLRFPVVPDQDGGLDYSEGPDKVRQAILLILDTNPGERIMRPTFGCGLRRYLMKPNSVATRALIQRDVERSIGTWEPRVQVTSVGVAPGDDPALVYIAIAYVHVRDRRPGNLVYPFYLE